MSYIGSNPITQYFLEGTDTFSVSGARTTFTLTRPVPSINAIQVITGTTTLAPSLSNYTIVNNNSLVLGASVSNTTVYVRYLTSSSYSNTPSVGSVNIFAIAATGTPSSSTFLRGDGAWTGVGIPQNVQTSAYTLVASDLGKHIAITTGGVTVPKDIFSAGDVVTIFNNSTANQTITQGASVTMTLAGTTTTGNRTLSQNGLATILCVAANTFIISGQGVS